MGKSTVAANLALALAGTSPLNRAPRVGLLDLDIFGPSVPKLMGLESAGEPALSERESPSSPVYLPSTLPATHVIYKRQ